MEQQPQAVGMEDWESLLTQLQAKQDEWERATSGEEARLSHIRDWIKILEVRPGESSFHQ